MTKNSDNNRCIRRYKKKDGTYTYHAEVRRKRAKPLRKVYKKLSDAKNWVRATESAILEGRLPQATKSRKFTVDDLIKRYLDFVEHCDRRRFATCHNVAKI